MAKNSMGYFSFPPLRKLWRKCQDKTKNSDPSTIKQRNPPAPLNLLFLLFNRGEIRLPRETVVAVVSLGFHRGLPSETFFAVVSPGCQKK